MTGSSCLLLMRRLLRNFVSRWPFAVVRTLKPTYFNQTPTCSITCTYVSAINKTFEQLRYAHFIHNPIPWIRSIYTFPLRHQNEDKRTQNRTEDSLWINVSSILWLSFTHSMMAIHIQCCSHDFNALIPADIRSMHTPILRPTSSIISIFFFSLGPNVIQHG